MTSLPDAELDVLARLERGGEMTAGDLREALASERPLAHASVMTLLQRLEAKSLVRRRKAPAGKAFLFSATGRARPALRRLLARLADRAFGGDPVSVVASLFETSAPSADELQRLEQLLAELRARRRPGGRP